MPNWCSNTLSIKGNPKDINKLMKQLEITESESTDTHSSSVFSCHKVIPRPDKEDTNWYNWNVENWGSKWDLSEVEKDGDWETGELRYDFETAWSPIYEVITALAKEHKKLTMTYLYSESGSDFWGEHEYKNGKEVSYEGGALSDASCERREYLMGNHHYCNECYEDLECNGDNTPTLCEVCIEKEDREDEGLWVEAI